MRLRVRSLLFYAIIFILANGYTAQADVLEKKTLKRWVDTVYMEGNMVAKTVGRPIANLRVYAYNDGVFEPIRYQIDERISDEGDFVYPEGPLSNPEDGNGKLDSWDMILFMVNDIGDKASKDSWIKGYTEGEEIEVVDPLTGEKGWVYLLYFASTPPQRSSLPDYAHYDYKTNSWKSDYSQSKCIITEDGLRSTYYDYWKLTEKAGGNMESWPDRLKIRTTVKLLGALTLRFNEELLKSNVLAYKNGPIRSDTRYEQYAYVPALKMKLLRAPTNTTSYRNYFLCPCAFQIPVKPVTVGVTSLVMRFANDFTPDVLGSKTCYSSDPNRWYQVDGKMDDNEKNFNPDYLDKWRLTTGDFGTMIFSAFYDPEFMKNITLTRGVIDDISKPDPPEKFPGCVGQSYQDWHLERAPRGLYFFYMNWLYVGHPKAGDKSSSPALLRYQQGDEIPYINFMEHPLKIRVGGKEWKSQVLELIKNIAKKHK